MAWASFVPFCSLIKMHQLAIRIYTYPIAFTEFTLVSLAKCVNAQTEWHVDLPVPLLFVSTEGRIRMIALSFSSSVLPILKHFH